MKKFSAKRKLQFLKSIDLLKLNEQESKDVYNFLLGFSIRTIQRCLYNQLFVLDCMGTPFHTNYSSGIKWRKTVEPPKCKITKAVEKLLRDTEDAEKKYGFQDGLRDWPAYDKWKATYLKPL